MQVIDYQEAGIMKKILVLLLLLFSISALYSVESEFEISLGILGFDVTSDMQAADVFGFGRLLNLTYKSYTGLGFTISPLLFFYADNDHNSLTFVNTSLFYNFLINTSENFIFGPLVTVSAVQYGHPSFVEFRSGLIFSFRSADIYYAKDSIFAIDVFHVEVGYRYNKTDRHGFFAHIGFDLVGVLYFIGAFSGKGQELDDYQKEHPQPWPY